MVRQKVKEYVAIWKGTKWRTSIFVLGLRGITTRLELQKGSRPNLKILLFFQLSAQPYLAVEFVPDWVHVWYLRGSSSHQAEKNHYVDKQTEILPVWRIGYQVILTEP
jgi:hypothetical protein